MLSLLGTVALTSTSPSAFAQTSPLSRALTALHHPQPATVANAATPLPPRYLDISNGMEALLRTIRFAEGTWRGGTQAGYQVIYGGRLIPEVIRDISDPFSKHPDYVVRKQTSLNSSAAGAYQFMPATWNRVAERLNIDDFSPLGQDQVALWLVRNRLSDAEEANINRGILTPEALHRLAPEWASLPTHRGDSYYGYGQAVKPWSQLKSFYDKQLELLRIQTEA